MEPSEKLSITFAGVKMRSPLGIATIHKPMVENSVLTPELHAEVLLKHTEAGAGFVYMPGCCYITEGLLAELRQRARPREFSTKPEGRRFMNFDTLGLGMESWF